jgi:23S rRNA (uridine2479-2'-O)-methyltransferase
VFSEENSFYDILSLMNATRVTRPNVLSNQWQSLLSNRNKRLQSKKFIVQGVRPINAAIANGWHIDSVLFLSGKLSDWARNIITEQSESKHYELSAEMMKALGEKNESIPELILIVRNKDISLSKLKLSDLKSKFILLLDRPQSPGNIGAVVRSADALGAALVIISGHSADIFDPKSIRAGRGSLFALPVVTAESPKDVQLWENQQKESFTIIGLSEDGDKNLWSYDLRQPTIAVIGNETWGLGKQWKEISDGIAVIPMHGTASSLNAASSAAIVMYEYSKQVG